MRNLEARLQRLEKRQPVPTDAREATDWQLWHVLGITGPAFVRLANSVDAKDVAPPADCTEAERGAWYHLRDVCHFDRLPF